MSSNNITQSQACIYIYYSNDNSLYGNNLTNSGYSQDGGGVWVERSHFNNIDGNFISESRWHGIELYRSLNNSILENEIISNNNRGIMVQTVSNYNTISGNTVNGNYKGIEITSSSHHNIINNNNITANQYEGIVIDYSMNNTISGNYLVDDNTGILIEGSSDYTNVTDNHVTGCGRAISLIQVSHCNLYGNNLTNSYFGLTLQSATENTLRETMMFNNTVSFSIIGYDLPHFINYVDESNTVDHKPIYYWIDIHDSIVPDDASCVVLVECTNIIAQNMNLSSCNRQGVVLAYSANITIADNYIARNDQYGIWLLNASECYIARNHLNGFICLQLHNALNNTFFGNTLTSGGNWGSVNLAQSVNNTFYHNNFTDNYIDYLIDDVSANNWDNGYPAGGNYWDNYEDRYPSARDENSGPYQNETGSDNIWDIPYTLNENNIDHYPLIPEFPSFILPLFMLAVSLTTLMAKKKRNV
ncbi:MAG: right-handed parallel beta-helix repeat-containing protein [Candidatus Bathyarchaeota archaeon]|nr:MAG: right-handed parallel beta-helix repeat-containing protein [Candidatus Bathyarchaeota archaeon]